MFLDSMLLNLMAAMLLNGNAEESRDAATQRLYASRIEFPIWRHL
jgi:hypothetical protein